ncbi:MAG: SGNH/GDSL hydrolase family protein [Pseudomonadota bacterium]
MLFQSAVFWLGFLLIIPQALYVRRVAHRADPAPGPRTGTVGSAEATLHLYGIGDSIIDGVGTSGLKNAMLGQTARALSVQLGANIAWQGAGRSGHRTAQVLELLSGEPPRGTIEFVIVSVGVNDVTGLRSLNQWRRDLRNLMLALREQCPAANVLMIGLPPMGEFPLLPQPLKALFGLRSRQFEAVALKALQQLDFVSYARIDLPTDTDSFAVDGYHPSEEACRELGGRLAHCLLADKVPINA